MKKIMMFAAIAAVAVAFGADCTRTTPGPKPAVVRGGVYQIKMQLKTTRGVSINASEKVITSGGVCNRTSSTNVTAGCVYRTADTITVDGWIVECTNSCKVIESAKVPIAWEAKRRTQITAPKFAWTFVNIMGRADTEAEAFGSFTGTLDYGAKRAQAIELYLAGQGKFDKNGGFYTSLSGNAAGAMTASYDLNPPANADLALACEASKVWNCTTYSAASSVCTLGKAEKTAVFGTWSIKYNSAASQKYFERGILDVPNYVVW